MKEYIKIDSDPNYVKDSESSAIINTNLSSLDAYKQQRKNALKLNNTEERINSLEQKMNGVYNMLSQILENTRK